MLGQLLLRNRSPIPELLSNYPGDSSDLIEPENVYPDTDNMVREQILERQQILERVNSILSDMVSMYTQYIFRRYKVKHILIQPAAEDTTYKRGIEKNISIGIRDLLSHH